jgi:hypothetical protein
MNDILERYKQIEAKVRNSSAELELYNKEGNIILRVGRKKLWKDRLGACILLSIIFGGWSFLLSKVPDIPILFEMLPLAVLVLFFWSMIKCQRPDGYCGIYLETQEFRIHKQCYLRAHTLLLQDISCFVGEFRWASGSPDGGGYPARRLYVVSQDGKMYRIDPYDPWDNAGKSLCEYLGFLCDKPVYLTDKHMVKENFITGPRNDLVFHLDAFLRAKKDFQTKDAH